MLAASVVLLVLCAVLAGLLFLKLKAALVASDALSREKSALEEKVSGLQGRVESLARYEVIEDAEGEAAAIRERASAEAISAVTAAKDEASRIINDANQVKQTASATAAETIADSNAQAERTIAEARASAEEAQTSAHHAKLETSRLEQTAEALKNVIEGYGNKYIVPTYGMLDELAEDFGFDDAGQKLKAARDATRQMAFFGRAATCDYVEINRKNTAIDFVVDAFNGKVDTILASVKHDNYGTLAQKIRDAFHLVNNNGRAFRSARINDAYLQARLEELKWAVVAQELKLRDKEEQRQLKERIREEERAQREYERAIRDAEKEQETLRKAMDKARREVERASDEQRAVYEQKLLELGEKLRAAEERNQRALSMAQQTRSGHVYVISNLGSFGENVYKIGLTRRLEPLDRVRELGDASVPFEFDVHAMIPSEDAPTLERALQKLFVRQQMNKVNARKEFFRVPIAEIRKEAEKLGCEAKWTMTAECREYNETLALERKMAEHSVDEDAWVREQLKAAEQAPLDEAEVVAAE